MVKMIRKWLCGYQKNSRQSNDEHRQRVVKKTREGTTWAINHYRGALEKLAEYDRS